MGASQQLVASLSHRSLLCAGGFLPFFNTPCQVQLPWLCFRKLWSLQAIRTRTVNRLSPSKQVTVTIIICYSGTSAAVGCTKAKRWPPFPTETQCLMQRWLTRLWSCTRALHKSLWHLLVLRAADEVFPWLASGAAHFINLAFIRANLKGQNQQPEIVSSFEQWGFPADER